MAPILTKATPERRKKPGLSPTPSSTSVIKPESVSGLAAMQAGVGNSALAAAATNGSAGASLSFFPHQSIYGNAAAQAAETETIGAETAKRRAAESPATYPVAVPEAGGIEPAVAAVSSKEESVKPAPTDEVGTLSSAPVAKAPAAVPVETRTKGATTITTPVQSTPTVGVKSVIPAPDEFAISVSPTPEDVVTVPLSPISAPKEVAGPSPIGAVGETLVQKEIAGAGSQPGTTTKVAEGSPPGLSPRQSFAVTPQSVSPLPTPPPPGEVSSPTLASQTPLLDEGEQQGTHQALSPDGATAVGELLEAAPATQQLSSSGVIVSGPVTSTPEISASPLAGTGGSDAVGESFTTSLTTDFQAPSAASAGAQLIIDQVTTVAATSRQRFVERLAQGVEEITANVGEQQQALEVAGKSQAAEILSVFDDAREQIPQIISNALSQLEADAAAQQVTLTQGHAAALSQVEATFIASQERAQDLGNTYAAQSIETANEAAQQVQSRVQGYAQEARSIGQAKARAGGGTPEIAQTKAQVANELATDTATKITEGMSDAMAQLSSTGPPTADAFGQQGQEAGRQLGAGQAQVVDQLTTTNQQATNAIQQTVTAGNQALTNLETQLLEQLSRLENNLLSQLQTQVAQKSQEIDGAGQQAIAAFQEQGQQALAAGDDNLAQLNEQIAGMNIDPTTAPEAAIKIVSQISEAYDSLLTTTDVAFQQVDSGLSLAGMDVVGAIEESSGSISAEVQSFLTQAQSQVSEQSTAICIQLAGTVTHTTTAGNSMVDKVAGSLDGQLTQLDQSFAQGLGDYRNHLSGQVTSAASQVREPVSTLPSRTDQAQSRAETRAQQGFWERQWNDFKEMVSDPGFWVGLVVGLILAVIVVALIVAGTLTGGLAIVAAFAIVGAIAAAVGSVVSQATEGSFSGGWKWSRVSGWKVLEAAAIGAVFGAVLAGAVLIMGPALAQSFAGIAILSVTAGVLTVIINKVTGQPWDKGLVANMLLVGILSLLAKYIPFPGRGRTGGGRGGTPPEPDPGPVPDPDPKPPGPRRQEPEPLRVVPGKLSLLEGIRSAQVRLANLRQRMTTLRAGDRQALEGRAQAVDQELARLQNEANAAESARRVQSLQNELERVKQDLLDLESSPLIRLGLRSEAIEAIETLENIKKDPVGDVNSVGNKNHYSAARREARGEVVSRRLDGRPFDHIRDLQESYNALQRVRRILEAEQRNPPDSITERGLDLLLDRYSQVQAILSRLKGFLDQIGNGPPFPPFHEWPPGS